MSVTKFIPHCCTAKIIVNFGESYAAEGGDFKGNKEDLEKDIREYIKREYNCGNAMLIAFTNNEQKTANYVFKKLGFRYSKWASKKAHADTKIRLWYINLEDAQKE